MPNHITNRIFCEYEDLERMKEIVSGDRVFDFSQIIPPPENIHRGNITSEEIKYLESKGIPCWYSWNIENWGTKWNAYNVEQTWCGFRFETAWSHPFPVIRELSKKMKFSTLKVAYADEDIGSNVGMYVIENGELQWKKEFENDNEREIFASCVVLDFQSELMLERDRTSAALSL